MLEKKVLRIGLAWCGNCSHTLWESFNLSRPPKLPYNAKSEKLPKISKFNYFNIFPISPGLGLPYFP